MIRNYFTTALRSIMRNKVYTLINILGLSTGVICCFLLAGYIRDANDNQHQTHLHDTFNTTPVMVDAHERAMPSTSVPVARRVKNEGPEVKSSARTASPASTEQLVRYNDNPALETEAPVADSTLLDITTYHSRSRNPKKALV